MSRKAARVSSPIVYWMRSQFERYSTPFFENLTELGIDIGITHYRGKIKLDAVGIWNLIGAIDSVSIAVDLTQFLAIVFKCINLYH